MIGRAPDEARVFHAWVARDPAGSPPSLVLDGLSAALILPRPVAASLGRGDFGPVAEMFHRCYATPGLAAPASLSRVSSATPAAAGAEPYPGADLGLPPSGRGSLATWGSRVGALVIDWGVCLVVAVTFFGSAVLTGGGWRAWMILATFFVESALLSTIAAGSLGQLLCRIAVVRLDGRPLGLPKALLRAGLVSLALPPLVVGAHRRGLQDLLTGTVVTNRR